MCMLIYIVASGSKKKGLLKFNPHEPRHALSLVCLVIPLIESAAIKKKKACGFTNLHCFSPPLGCLRKF